MRQTKEEAEAMCVPVWMAAAASTPFAGPRHVSASPYADFASVAFAAASAASSL